MEFRIRREEGVVKEADMDCRFHIGMCRKDFRVIRLLALRCDLMHRSPFYVNDWKVRWEIDAL